MLIKILFIAFLPLFLAMKILAKVLFISSLALKAIFVIIFLFAWILKDFIRDLYCSFEKIFIKKGVL